MNQSLQRKNTFHGSAMIQGSPFLPRKPILQQKNTFLCGRTTSSQGSPSLPRKPTLQRKHTFHGVTVKESALKYGSLSRQASFPGVKVLPLPRQDISKEYLTLQFYDENKTMSETEKVAVKKGKSLKESIETLLNDRGIDFSTHSVFLESSKTPLPLAFDTFPLGGNVLHVKENHSMQVDERIITLMKSAEDDNKRLQSQRPRKNLMSSIFNDDVEMSPTNNKGSVSRKSGVAMGIANANKEENRTLSELLNHYTFNHFTTENDVDGYENSLEETFLEESWTDVITEHEGMTNKEKIQQETIWELLITERNYLRKLRVIIMVFKNCLVSLQNENFLEEVDINQLFANIKEVYDTNLKFWEDHLKHVTEDARQTKQPIRPSQLHDSFASFEELFQPYIKYCMEEGSCMKYLKQLKRENEMFQEYLAWCENHRQCMRLKLADLFVKPMQRVTKYALLLKAILGKTTDEDEQVALRNMIFQVDRFVTKINTTLRLRNEQQKLDDVLERMETYAPIDAASEEIEKLLESQYCSFDLHGNIPGLPEEEQRCILLEGPMKLIEKNGRSDVHAFLFTDVFILSKTKKGNDKFRIIRQPFRLNKIVLHRSKDVGAFIFIYLNEYGVLVTAFTLVVSQNEQVKWINAIEKAKKRYEDARAAKGSTLDFFDDDLTQSASMLVNSLANTVSPFVDRRATIADISSHLDPTSAGSKDELRCRSTDAVTRSFQKPEDVTSESHVKRSLSDPKTGISYPVRERSSSKQKGRPRPKSLVNISDHDIANWVLTNENRNQSGSITSDVSDDSQRSSGIGDSFRSINSDGGSMVAMNPELSKVQALKARFENQGCESPVNTEGSDSSTSVLGLAETSPALTNARRITPPDYMDDHLTIKEEEEHSAATTVIGGRIPTSASGLSSIADSDKDTENDSSGSLRTLHEVDGNTSRLPTCTMTYVDNSSQTDVDFSSCDKDRNRKESAVQCELLTDNLNVRRTDFPSPGRLDAHLPVQNNNLECDLSSSESDKETITTTASDSPGLTTVEMFENITSSVTSNHDRATNIDNNVTPADRKVTTVDNNVTTVDRNVTTVDRKVSTVDKSITTIHENVMITNERIITNGDSSREGSRKSSSNSKNSIEEMENVVTTNENVVITSQNIVITSEPSNDIVTRDLNEFEMYGIAESPTEGEEISATICETILYDSAEDTVFVDAWTQCDTDTITRVDASDHAKSDSSTQYEVCSKDTSTQCGDFIQLAGKEDGSGSEKKHRSPLKQKNSDPRNACPAKPVYKASLSDQGSNGRSVSPFMDMLIQTSRPLSVQIPRRPVGTLKHSYSDENMTTVTSISHGRSRSDEPQQSSLPNSPEHKHRNSAPSTEFPGMRALQTLSESLESSLQHRLEAPIVSKPIVKHYEDDVVKLDTNKNISNNINVSSNLNVSSNHVLVRTNSSTSLRKLAILNNSPRITKKELDDDSKFPFDSEAAETDSFNEDLPVGNSSPKLRTRVRSNDDSNSTPNNNKRFTWHDFDSLHALKQIERAKYGPSGSGRTSTLPLTRSLSKSTEIISSNNKKSSLKRSIIKRFTDVLNRSDESRSSSLDCSREEDEKSLKKKQKKERKKIKKEKRSKEKEEKKRDSVTTKLRSASVSSANSRLSLPVSSTTSSRHSSIVNTSTS